MMRFIGPTITLLSLALACGCGRPHDHAAEPGHVHTHQHAAPHGGMLVEVGDHQFNVELVHDAGTGTLTLYTLDAHAENFVRTAMPVIEATHGLRMQPNHVYVIPPNSNLAIAQGALLVSLRSEAPGPHVPVDYLLRSLAQDQKSRAIGVILSGAAADLIAILEDLHPGASVSYAVNYEAALAMAARRGTS